MRLNRDEGAKKLWIPVRQKKEFADLHELFEKSFVFQLPQHQWNAYSTQVN